VPDLKAAIIQLTIDMARANENTLKMAQIATEAIQDTARLRAMLRRLEWCDTDANAFAVALGGQYTAHRCPICNWAREASSGHASDCELAALLGEAADA
jgi:hypothetical protein